ncbi:MAG: ABC transporter ATP-binding protein [Candidatus Thorarchaeota archaeon]
METALEMREVCKTFYGEGEVEIRANDNVNFKLRKGEIHALLGENGAGKSTLIMNLCRRPDSGSVIIEGRELDLKTPRDALEHGIGIAYQDLSRTLIERHTVAENVLSLTKGFLLSIDAVEDAVREALQKFDLGELDPKMAVWKLSGGEKQRVEILKALITDPRIIILDEPTSMLTPPEVDGLFALLESLKAQGKAIVIITHHLEEAIRISDRITVLRRGQVVDTLDEEWVQQLKANPSKGVRELARLMVGRDALYDLKRTKLQEGQIVMQVRDVCVDNDMGMQVVNNISLDVRSGEILGLAGIAGNGQRELLESIVHMRDIKSGAVILHSDTGEMNVTNMSIAKIRNLGVSYIPENRKKAMVLDLSVRENLMMSYYSDSKGPLIDHETIVSLTDKLIEQFSVDTPSPLAPMRSLSGGNKQKVVVAREISRKPKQGLKHLLIAENPTSGLDVATTQFVREELLRQRDSGTAILLVSSDLTEILTLSDRISVIYKGEIIGTLSSEDATREQVGLMMGGYVADSLGPMEESQHEQ